MKNRISSGLFFIVLVIVAAVSIPALDIYLWGDDFGNLNTAFEIHEAPMRAVDSFFVFFRPTMLASMYLSYQLFGTDPVLYNLSTLAHHLIVVALLFCLLRNLDRTPFEAASVALLFGTTPLASEATTWTGARADVLLAIVVLAVLVVLSRSETVLQPRIQLVLGGLYLVGMATKESWMVLPVVVTAFLVIVRQQPVKRAVLGALSGWILLIVYVLFFFVLPQLSGHSSPLDYGGMDNTPGQMIAKFGRLVCHYLSIGHAHGSETVRAICGLVVFGAGMAVALWRRNRLSLFGGVFLVLALAPTIRFGMSPSRFNYLALIGFLTLVIPLVAEVLPSPPSRFARLTALLAVGILVAHQVSQLNLEFDDYRGFADRHRFLADAATEIAPLIESSSSILLVNLGTVDGPIEFRDAAVGLPKNIYPKPGGPWNLVRFHDIANFTGSPFERRVVEVPVSQVDAETIAEATPILFRDTGFVRCHWCEAEVLHTFNRSGRLPGSTTIYRVIPAES